LASNFGTFLLYGLSCFICMVAYHKHPNFKFIRHWAIPAFGILANIICMAFYLIGPFLGYGTKNGAFHGLRDSRGLGHLWRHLLRALKQSIGPHDVCHQPRHQYVSGWPKPTSSTGRAQARPVLFLWRVI
jgi:hypothetical protein